MARSLHLLPPVAAFAVEVESLNHLEGSLSRLMQQMDRDKYLLKRTFGGNASVWEWILRQKCAAEVASQLLRRKAWSVPINAVNPITGDSVVTKSDDQVLDPGVFKILLDSGERLDYINKKTGDSFLHALAKLCRNPRERKGAMVLLMELIEEMEKPLLEVFEAGEVNFPDPDYKNTDGMTALHLSLEANDIPLALVLVQRLGASWTVRPSGRFSSVYALTSNEDVLCLIGTWDIAYGFCANGFEVGKEGDVCMVCCEALDVSHEVYSMECCGALIHVECFRTYLSRSPKPNCMFCNMLVVEEVRCKIPDTIYKKKWGPHITKEAITTAAAARARTAAMQSTAELAKKTKEKEEEEAKRKREEPGVEYSSIDEIVWEDITSEEENSFTLQLEFINQPTPRRRLPPVFDDGDDDDFVPQTITFRLPLSLRKTTANNRTRRSAARSSTTNRRRGRETSRRRYELR